MSAEETEPKPNEKSGVGSEKPFADDQEAGGRRHRFFTCENCGAGNYYEPSWNAINCWRCGVPNWPDK